MSNIIGTAKVDSSLLNQEEYLYQNITRGIIYPIYDIATSDKTTVTLIKIRDNINVARWVPIVYFSVILDNEPKTTPDTSTKARLLSWFNRLAGKRSIGPEKETKPVEALKMAGTGSPLVDQFLVLFGP